MLKKSRNKNKGNYPFWILRNLMIIDFHTHLLPPSFIKENYDQVMKDQTFASMFGKSDLNLPSTEDLIRSMEADHIDASVVMGYGWCDYEIAKASNDFIFL